jgi:4-hydroxythreonine-4-phosphate dehydrogenase
MTGNTNRPRIAVVMGDAAGIGPELVLQVLQNETLTSRASLLVLGSTHVLQQAAEALRVEAPLVPVESMEQAGETTDGIPVLECDIKQNSDFRWGESNAANGANAIAQIKKAVKLAEANEVDGVVIGPLNKEAMHKAGFEYPDEIVFLGELAGTTVRTVVTWNNIYRSSSRYDDPGPHRAGDPEPVADDGHARCRTTAYWRGRSQSACR